MITENDIKAYVDMPAYFTNGCSKDMFVFQADGGNHFTDYGIFVLIFNLLTALLRRFLIVIICSSFVVYIKPPQQNYNT